MSSKYMLCILLGTWLEYLWPGSTKQELSFGQSFTLNPNQTKKPQSLLSKTSSNSIGKNFIIFWHPKKNPVYYLNKIQK